MRGDAALLAATLPSWLALAACGSVLLLATTNQLCQEVTTVPFLWVVPLALYLTTFIICFDHERWYHRPTFLPLLMVALFAASYAHVRRHEAGIVAADGRLLRRAVGLLHGVSRRTGAQQAGAAARHAVLLDGVAGGALGGVLVAVVAPLVLPDFWEYQIALCATVVLAFWTTYRDGQRKRRKPISVWMAGVGLMPAVGLGHDRLSGHAPRPQPT